jgi:hypothetical protein
MLHEGSIMGLLYNSNKENEIFTYKNISLKNSGREISEDLGIIRKIILKCIVRQRGTVERNKCVWLRLQSLSGSCKGKGKIHPGTGHEGPEGE